MRGGDGEKEEWGDGRVLGQAERRKGYVDARINNTRTGISVKIILLNSGCVRRIYLCERVWRENYVFRS